VCEQEMELLRALVREVAQTTAEHIGGDPRLDVLARRLVWDARHEIAALVTSSVAGEAKENPDAPYARLLVALIGGPPRVERPSPLREHPIDPYAFGLAWSDALYGYFGTPYYDQESRPARSYASAQSYFRALASATVSMAQGEPPSTDERQAKLLDGRMQGAERNEMLEHLSASDVDRRVVTDTAAILLGLEEEEGGRSHG